jgi:phosphoribosylanthranilate isomerase
LARTLVKVCGLTRADDARTAIAAGADWLGFVLLGESPRLVDSAAAAEIAAACPGATTVAVLVAPTPEQALALATRARAKRVQLHRVDPARWPADFPLPVTFAVPVGEDGRLAGALPDERHLLLLDTADPAHAGGTGRVFPWEAAARLAFSRPVLLAGGLDADNVTLAIERVRPFGVDASSRLEAAPGRKDPDKVRLFVAAVRACDARQEPARKERA